MDYPDLTRLVHKLAHRYAWCGAPKEDLVAEGFLGLQIAKERFDPSRGVKFITYAHHWIRGKVQKAADKHIKANTDTSSLDIQNENGRSRGESIADEGPSQMDVIASSGRDELIAGLLASLSTREVLVISRRFGMDAPSPCAHRVEVRQAEAAALAALRVG